MDWLSRQLWAAPAQSARPYFLTERLLACVYGERGCAVAAGMWVCGAAHWVSYSLSGAAFARGPARAAPLSLQAASL